MTTMAHLASFVVTTSSRTQTPLHVWPVLGFIALAGAIGGIINAIASDNGFVLPKSDHGVLRPGFIGNVVVGIVAAGASWGLYGTASTLILFPASSNPSGTTFQLTVSAFFTAMVVGIGGARWLSNEVDKKLLRNAATEAASRKPDPATASGIASAKPAAAVALAESLPAK